MAGIRSTFSEPYRPIVLAPVLFFLLNGLATLLAETVWVKQAIVLFGAAPSSYGSVLCAYFVGTAIGAAAYPRFDLTRSARRMAAAFTIALLVSIGLPPLLAGQGHRLLAWAWGSTAYDVIRWSIAFISIVPVCAFWGALFPIAARAVSRSRFIVLYGVQTAGAAVGICLGSFWLPYAVGYRAMAALAVAVNLASLLALFRFAAPVPSAQSTVREGTPKRGGSEAPLSRRYVGVAFSGGFLALALEVLFIRFVAIGTDNSIYAFGSASLGVVVLLTLAAWVTPRLPGRWFTHQHALHAVMILSFAGVFAVVAQFQSSTHGLSIVPAENLRGFMGELAFTLPIVALGYAVPSLLLPFLLRFVRARRSDAARARYVGQLVAANTAGCALGALVTSFVLLPHLGMWVTATVIAAGYAGMMLLLDGFAIRASVAVLAFLLVLFANPIGDPLTTPTNPWAPGANGRVVSAREGAFGIVSVVDYPDYGRSLWLNDNYELEAGRANVQGTQRMGILPTLLQPSARRLMMIGIGTGITASGFLAADVSRIDLVELVPEVREAAQQYFSAFNLGALDNPRVHPTVADGRQFLAMSRERYDVIVSDLFTPFHEGAAYLYTREHFESVRARLAPRGVFVLWLPMYQLTRSEFLAIARTFALVFDAATIWQLEMSTDSSVFALVAGAPFDVDALSAGLTHRDYSRRPIDIVERHPAGIFFRYVGPAAALERGWSAAPIITTDRPILEHLAAESGRRLLKDDALLGLAGELFAAQANPAGKLFSRWDSTLETWRQSGFVLNRYAYERAHGHDAEAQALFAEARANNPVVEQTSQ